MADFGGSQWHPARTRKGPSNRQDFLRAECKGDSKRFDELRETVFCNNFATLRNQDNSPAMTSLPLFAWQRSSYCNRCCAPSTHLSARRPFRCHLRCRHFAFGHLRILEKGSGGSEGGSALLFTALRGGRRIPHPTGHRSVESIGPRIFA